MRISSYGLLASVTFIVRDMKMEKKEEEEEDRRRRRRKFLTFYLMRGSELVSHSEICRHLPRYENHVELPAHVPALVQTCSVVQTVCRIRRLQAITYHEHRLILFQLPMSRWDPMVNTWAGSNPRDIQHSLVGGYTTLRVDKAPSATPQHLGSVEGRMRGESPGGRVQTRRGTSACSSGDKETPCGSWIS